MLIKNQRMRILVENMAESLVRDVISLYSAASVSVLCVGHRLDMTMTPKIWGNLGSDYKGYKSECSEHVLSGWKDSIDKQGHAVICYASNLL